MEEIESLLESAWPSNAFAMLKVTFRKHWLIKISMTYVHIKTEVKKK